MQKKVGDALYVLDLTPYVITEDTDVSIIYVQNEKIKEYKELNTELASKMYGFNQFIMAVQPLPWAEDGGGDDPGPGPDPTGHTLTLDGSDIHAHIDVYLNNEQVQTTIEYTDVAAGTAIKITPEAGASSSWYTVIQGVEWDDNVQAWVATMPDEDYRITMDYIGEPQPQGHTFTITGQYITAACDVYFDGVKQDWNESDNGSWSNVPQGTTIGIIPYYDSSDYTTELPMEESGEYTWVVIMPDEDLTITIDYNGGSGESGESGAS